MPVQSRCNRRLHTYPRFTYRWPSKQRNHFAWKPSYPQPIYGIERGFNTHNPVTHPTFFSSFFPVIITIFRLVIVIQNIFIISNSHLLKTVVYLSQRMFRIFRQQLFIILKDINDLPKQHLVLKCV